MTEVLFYHLQNMSLESVLPPLLEKSLERGWRVVVQSTSQERTDALAAARGAWTDCRTRGFEVTYWQADERGRWQRRE